MAATLQAVMSHIFVAHSARSSRMGEQSVDLFRPFVRVGIGQELPHFVGRRQSAQHVDRRPAEELLVGGRRRDGET